MADRAVHEINKNKISKQSKEVYGRRRGICASIAYRVAYRVRLHLVLNI